MEHLITTSKTNLRLWSNICFVGLNQKSFSIRMGLNLENVNKFYNRKKKSKTIFLLWKFLVKEERILLWREQKIKYLKNQKHMFFFFNSMNIFALSIMIVLMLYFLKRFLMKLNNIPQYNYKKINGSYSKIKLYRSFINLLSLNLG